MSFLFPLFLAGAAAVAVPIVLHLMRRERLPRLSFSDLRFLRRTTTVHTRRRRLRELLLLALRVSALLLLTLAFARPYLDGAAPADQSASVVVLDRSASMGAPETFADARALTVRAIEEAPSEHLVGFVTFDERADVAHELTTDRRVVQSIAAATEPGRGSTRFAAGIAAAVDLLGPRPGRIVLVTDRQSTGWRGETTVTVPTGVEVEVKTVPPARENLAITGVEVAAAGVNAMLLNTGPPRSVAVTATVGGRSRSATADLAAGRTAVDIDIDVGTTETGRPIEGAVLTVSVQDPHGLPADNQRTLRLGAEPVGTIRVGVIGDGERAAAGAFFVERALKVGDQDRAFTVEFIGPDAVASEDLSERGVLAVADTTGLHRRSRAAIAGFVSAGGGLLVLGGPRLDPALVADVLGTDESLGLVADETHDPVRLSVTNFRHPVFLGLGRLVDSLGQVRVRDAVRIVEAAPMQVLARFDTGGAALVEVPTGRGRVLVFASDLNNEWNDFPRRPAFVPFVRETMSYLASDRTATADNSEADVSNVDPAESLPTRETLEAFAAHIVTRERPSADGTQASQTLDADELEVTQGYWWFALLALGVVLVAESVLGRGAVSSTSVPVVSRRRYQ